MAKVKKRDNKERLESKKGQIMERKRKACEKDQGEKAGSGERFEIKGGLGREVRGEEKRERKDQLEQYYRNFALVQKEATPCEPLLL